MDLGKIKKGVLRRTMPFINQKRIWTTDRKILVIESDDWGAIRMPNKEVYNSLLQKGISVDKCNYCINDTIADKYDLEDIFQTFSSIKNNNGENPKITANTIVANPNFEKIKADNFEKYHYETIVQTFKRYPNRDLDFWKEGMKSNIFKPQLHGREHVNIERWLKALQSNSAEMRLAFDNNMYGITSSVSRETKLSYLEALKVSDENINQYIDDAVKIFYELFGFHSETFIAPNYCWNNQVEKRLHDNKIFAIQGGSFQIKDGKDVYHYLGEKNKFGQHYMTRNVLFEPSLRKDSDIVNKTFLKIKDCFNKKSPAIICSHRLNFIGAINEKNRVENLKKMKELLLKVINAYPDVEFMFSDELFHLIKQDQ